MADNVQLPITGVGGTPDAVVATDVIAAVHYQRVKVAWGVDGAAVDASATDPFPVSAASLPLPTGAATQVTLAAIATDIAGILTQDTTTATKAEAIRELLAGTLTVTGPLTDTQLRATAVPVSGTVTSNVGTGTQPVSGTVTATPGVNTVSPVTQIMTISTAAVVVPNATQGSSVALSGRKAIYVHALKSNTGIVYIGGSGVTADEAVTGGKKLAAGDGWSDESGTGTLYAIASASGQKLWVYER